MWHIIFDDTCNAFDDLNEKFFSEQLWQMNLMHAVNASQGIAKLLARELDLGLGLWMLASPIYWRASHHDVMIVGDRFNQQVLSVYFDAFRNFLMQDQIPVFQYAPDLWLFDAEFLGLESELTHLNAVMHRSLYHDIQQWSPPLRLWWTEIQMLFQQIQIDGTCCINGVWPWGTGRDLMHDTKIFRYSETTAFSILGDLPVFEDLMMPPEGVLLVDQTSTAVVFSKLNSGKWAKYPLKIWWRNGWQCRNAMGLWDKFRSWIKYAD